MAFHVYRNGPGDLLQLSTIVARKHRIAHGDNARNLVAKIFSMACERNRVHEVLRPLHDAFRLMGVHSLRRNYEVTYSQIRYQPARCPDAQDCRRPDIQGPYGRSGPVRSDAGTYHEQEATLEEHLPEDCISSFPTSSHFDAMQERILLHSHRKDQTRQATIFFVVSPHESV